MKLKDALKKWDALNADDLACKIKQAGIKGSKFHNTLCPLAKALMADGIRDVRVYNTIVNVVENHNVVQSEQLSDTQWAFIYKFDDGKYPFLEKQI